MNCCRRQLGVPGEAIVEVTVAGDGELAALNKEYRGREGATDVLAFEFGRDSAEPTGVWIWGEVYVSADRARAQAAARDAAVAEEILALVAHGMLHIAGYGHGTPARRAEMEKRAAALEAACGSRRER